jgi:hypothetical protein
MEYYVYEAKPVKISTAKLVSLSHHSRRERCGGTRRETVNVVIYVIRG